MKIIKTETPRDVVLHQDEYPANLEPTDVVEIFETPLTGTYNWDYTVQDNRIKKLYELGKKLNWNVEVDVDWTPEYKGMDPEEFEDFIKSSDAKNTLILNTDELINRRGFGSPTFFYNDYMFFGNDRLALFEDLLARKLLEI